MCRNVCSEYEEYTECMEICYTHTPENVLAVKMYEEMGYLKKKEGE